MTRKEEHLGEGASRLMENLHLAANAGFTHFWGQDRSWALREYHVPWAPYHKCNAYIVNYKVTAQLDFYFGVTITHAIEKGIGKVYLFFFQQRKGDHPSKIEIVQESV